MKNEHRKLPDALAPMMKTPNWIVWRGGGNKNGKREKLPYQVNGIKAATDKPEHWVSYRKATDAARSGRFDGVGFVLTGTDFAAFDLDDCIEDGLTDLWVSRLVGRAMSYAEVTVSGTGMRIIGVGSGLEVHRKFKVNDKVSCEVYRKATRFIVMTGDTVNYLPLVNLDKVIDEVVEELDQKKKSSGAKQLGTNELPTHLVNMLHVEGAGA